MIDGMLTSDNDKSPIEWEDLPDTCPACDSPEVEETGAGEWCCNECGVEWIEEDDEPGEGDADEF